MKGMNILCKMYKNVGNSFKIINNHDTQQSGSRLLLGRSNSISVSECEFISSGDLSTSSLLFYVHGINLLNNRHLDLITLMELVSMKKVIKL